MMTLKHLFFGLLFGASVGFIATKAVLHYSHVEQPRLAVPAGSGSIIPDIPSTQVSKIQFADTTPPNSSKDDVQNADNADLSQSSSAVNEYAAKHAISLEESKRRLKRESELRHALDQIVTVERDAIAGYGIKHEYDVSGWVWFVGDHRVSEESLVILNNNNDIEVRDGALFSLDSLEDQVEFLITQNDAAHDSSMPESIRDSIMHTDINLRENMLVVYIDETSSSSIATEEIRTNVEGWLASVLSVPFYVEAM